MAVIFTTIPEDDVAVRLLRQALPDDPDEWLNVEGTVKVSVLAVRDVVNRFRPIEDYTERELRWLLACFVADWTNEQASPSADWQFGYKATWLPLQGSQVLQVMHNKGIEP